MTGDPNPYAPPKAEAGTASTEYDPGGTELASRWLRLGGHLIDVLFLVGIAFGLTFLVAALSPDMVLSLDDDLFGGDSRFYLLIGLVFAIYLGTNIPLWHYRGQSLGKLLLGMKIIRADGARAPLWRILFLRTFPILILGEIPLIGRLISIVDAVLIFRDSRQCLHDDFADTIVIRLDDHWRANP
ncbi:MAG: RDD family protein [Verrucomicrobiales bacterium]